MRETFKEFVRGLVARPALVVTPPFLLGILLASHREDHAEWILWIAAFLLWTLLLLLGRRRPPARDGQTPASTRFLFTLLMLALLAFGVGWVRHRLHHDERPAPSDVRVALGSETAQVEGRILKAPERGRRAWQVLIGAESCRTEAGPERICSGKILLFVKGDALPGMAGDRIRVKGRFRAVEEEGNPGEFSYSDYLARSDIHRVAYLRTPSSMEALRRDDGMDPVIGLERWRSALAGWIEETAPGPDGETLKALVLGMSKGMDPEIRRVYTAAGTAHLLSISGLHLSILAVGLFALASLLWRRWAYRWNVGASRWAAAVTLPLVWAYALLAGLHIPTIRSAIMITLYLAARLIWRRSDALNCLAISAWMILLWDVESLFDAGFQLSFVSVWAILVAESRLEGRVPARAMEWLSRPAWVNRTLVTLLRLAITGLICFLATMPILAGWFNQISWASLFLNILIVPLFTLVLTPGLGLVALAHLLGLPLDQAGLLGLNEVLRWVVHIQTFLLDHLGGTFHSPRWTMGATFLYMGGLTLAVLSLPPPGGPRGRPGGDLWNDRRAAWTLRGMAVGLLLGFAALRAWDAPMPPEIRREGGGWLLSLKEGHSLLLLSPGMNLDLFSTGRINDPDRDRNRDAPAKALGHLGIGRIRSAWSLYDSPPEERAREAVASRFPIGSSRFLTSPPPESCRREDAWRRCRSDRTELWFRETSPPSPRRLLVLHEMEHASLVLVPFPRSVKEEDWAELRAHWPDRPLSLVVFGFFEPEELAAILRIIPFKGVAFSVDDYLGRKVRRGEEAEWERVFPGLWRTDRDGAAEIRPDGEIRSARQSEP